jgi:hypothetical protein
VPVTSSKGALPVDAREALHWFVNNFGLYIGSTRGLFITDWGEEHEATLEAAIINLKSRGFTPVQVTGDTLYKQADYLWKESRANTAFGRPLASKLELELSGSDIVIVDSLEEFPPPLVHLQSFALSARDCGQGHDCHHPTDVF